MSYNNDVTVPMTERSISTATKCKYTQTSVLRRWKGK